MHIHINTVYIYNIINYYVIGILLDNLLYPTLNNAYVIVKIECVLMIANKHFIMSRQ